MDVGGPGPLWGGPSPRLSARSFLSSGTRGVFGPVPKRRTGPGPSAWCGKGLTRGARQLRPLGIVTDNYAGPALLQ